MNVPMPRVELVMNGEIRESVGVDPARAADSLRVAVRKSSWLALLVRGQYPDKPEIVAAHTSPVMAEVEGSSFEAAADAYRRMRLVLESADRSLHNRMHRQGRYHEHPGPRDHPEHH